MEPEWKHDLRSIEHPNNPVPQFELMGFQEDVKQDQKTIRKIVVVISSIASVIAFIMVLSYISDAKNIHKKMIVEKGNTKEKNPFINRIGLVVLNTKRLRAIDSMFGKTKSKPGFRFFIANVKITNRSKKNFQVNPYGVALFTDNDKRYNPHVGQRKLGRAIKSKSLKPGAVLEGEFLYEIPANASPIKLVIKSYSGPIASYQF